MNGETHANEEMYVVGAGPAGLASAIAGANAGLTAVVYERRADVGGRFHGDFQGLENWTTDGDVLDELAAIGIRPTFDHIPVHEQVCYDPEGREYRFRSDDPLYYLVHRGPGEGTLDQSLKEQALSTGAEVRFKDPVRHLPEGGVVSKGPRGADAVAVGYLFETDAADGSHGVVNNQLAPNGYSYLITQGGLATLASCMFHDFRNEEVYVERTIDCFSPKSRLQREGCSTLRRIWKLPLARHR